MKIGDKVIVKPKPYGNHLQFKCELPFNCEKGVIIEFDRIGRACIAFDDFPEVNHREKHNRYWYSIDELEVVG